MIKASDIIRGFFVAENFDLIHTFEGNYAIHLMTFTFLFFAVSILLFPIVFHLHKKIFNGGYLKAAIGASLVAAMLMSTINLVLVKFNVIVYNVENSSDLLFQGLPFTQCLLYFSLSFTIVAVYQYANIHFPKNTLQKYSLAVSHFMLGLCIAFLFFGYTKLFTLVTFSTLFLALFAVEYMSKLRFMYKTYRTFLLILLPAFAIYAILIKEQAMKVNYAAIVEMDILGVPLEQHFLLLLNTVVAVNMFKFFSAKNKV